MAGKVRSLQPYAASAAIVAACTLVCTVMFGLFDDSNLIMVYLLGVAVVSSRYGRGPSAFAACLGVACFDLFFVPPHFTFTVADTQYLVTFVVMLVVAVLISSLAVRARAEAAAAQAALLAVEQERLRSTLLSSVSHDFRTPLAAITGAVTCLQEERALEPESRRDLEQTIREEAERLDRLVTNLLDMTRLEAGAVELRRDWDSVEEVIGSALARVEERLGERRLETDIADDLPLVRIDAGLVEQVLVNLLENALKHTPAGTAIRIAARLEGDAVLVTVEDEGQGLPPGQEETVFAKYHRAGRPEGSFGLGLAICRAILTAHGGRIWAARDRPRGAAFQFTLPASDVAPATPPAA